MKDTGPGRANAPDFPPHPPIILRGVPILGRSRRDARRQPAERSGRLSGVGEAVGRTERLRYDTYGLESEGA